MSFETYDGARPFAEAIHFATQNRSMPPWFAAGGLGRFINDPSLGSKEIATLAAWAAAHAPAGNPDDQPAPHQWAERWNIPQPDLVVKMTRPVALPATGDVDYTYEIVPTQFAQDRWVQMAEVLPSARANVHHAVVYIRPPDSNWLRHAPVGEPFTAATLQDPEDRRGAHWTDNDVLLVYAPGSSPDEWPDTMAKFVPAGSDLVFQMHYTTNGKATEDQSSVGLVFSKRPPPQRVLTLQLTNDHFVIPPGADNFRVEARGTLPNDAILLSFFPHMHLRGKRFEYNLVKRRTGEQSRGGAANGASPAEIETLLKRFPRLRDRLNSRAGLLSGGEQQMLAIARGMMARPRILLLDEPSLGLAPAMINELFDVLADLRDEGITILLVDQMAVLALAVTDRGYVIDSGRLVREDSAANLAHDPEVEAAYLGRAEAAQ